MPIWLLGDSHWYIQKGLHNHHTLTVTWGDCDLVVLRSLLQTRKAIDNHVFASPQFARVGIFYVFVGLLCLYEYMELILTQLKFISYPILTMTWFKEQLFILRSLLPTKRDIESISLISCHSPRSVYLSLIHISLLSHGAIRCTCFTYETRPIIAVNQYFATYMIKCQVSAMMGYVEIDGIPGMVCRCAFTHEVHTDRLPLDHSSQP